VCVCVNECVCLTCVHVRLNDRMSGRVHERVNGGMYERQNVCVFV